MGSGASITSIETLTKEQTGDLVAGIGQAYEGYREIFISEGIDGVFFAKLSDLEIKETLSDLGITKPLHQKNICAKFEALKATNVSNSSPTNTTGSSNVANVPNALNVIKTIAAVVHDLDMPAKVTKTPRQLMSELFAIQGIPLDPSDLDPAIDKITSTVGSSGGVCDGVKTYDVFINYRVAADADLAEKLYLYLKTKGISAFLDQKCLKAGEPWKEGFLSGLSRSRKFLCLISADALANVRNKAIDHSYDNVLLEYETALMIRGDLGEKDADMARSYILPILVGHFSQGVLTKFIAFSPTLYPDSVVAAVAVAVTGEEKMGAGNSPRGSPRLPPIETYNVPTADLSTTQGALEALRVQPLGPAEAEAALKAIANMCFGDHATTSCVLFGDSGGCALVVDVFERFADNNAFVAHQACRVAINTTFGLESLRDQMIAAGLCEVLVQTVRAFPSNADVVWSGCLAVTNLAAGTDGVDKRRGQLVAAGACEAIVTAMKACPTDADAAQYGCRAIVNLTNGTDGVDKRRDQLVAAGACAVVVAALEALPLNGEVANYGCWAVSNLACGTDGADTRRGQIVAAGACEAIVAALQAIPSDAGVAEMACTAIGNICWDGGADLRKRFIDLDACAAIEGSAAKADLVTETIDILTDENVEDDVTFPAGVVAVKNHRNVGRIFADSSVRFRGFNTVVGDIRINTGSYYYEVEVLTMGLWPQFGWATEGFEAADGYVGSGVGDDKISWGVDGHRVLKWHNGEQPFGREWVTGDVIGFALDLTSRTMLFSVNGDYSPPCGVAFTGIDLPAGWVQPALTAQSGKYRLNFGEADRPFKFAPPAV
jgi:hypothetical protein